MRYDSQMKVAEQLFTFIQAGELAIKI